MNLPNQLTLARVILTFIFIYFISKDSLASIITAFLIFCVASLTDFYDGYLAKRNNWITDFGKLMDPLADKFLLLAAFLAFVRMQVVDVWMVVIILGREIVITSLRLFALSKGKVIPAERAGKHKTVSQIVAVISIFLFIMIRKALDAKGLWSLNIENWWEIGIDILMLITVALTLISGISYLWTNKNLIRM